MVTLEIAGKEVFIEGHGTEDEPFIVHGIKKSPSLAAAAEEAMIDHWMGAENWEMLKTRLERSTDGRVTAILTIFTSDERNNLVKGDVWFDVTEAFNSHHA